MIFYVPHVKYAGLTHANGIHVRKYVMMCQEVRFSFVRAGVQS